MMNMSLTQRPRLGYALGEPSAPSATLVIQSGFHKGARYLLRDPFLIGRNPISNLELDDRKASRAHAIIIPTSKGFWIQDLDSRNGTFVNGKKIRKTILKDQDEIQVGLTFMRFFSKEPLMNPEESNDMVRNPAIKKQLEDTLGSDDHAEDSPHEQQRQGSPQKQPAAGKTLRGMLISWECGHCGAREVGIVTSAGRFVPLKLGTEVELSSKDLPG